MDAFESIISAILVREGFWVQNSFKVLLTLEEKREINRPTTPRWEIDIVAYRPGDNLLRIVECKSYLDSKGVTSGCFGEDLGEKSRYKLFNEPKTRKIVFRRLVKQLLESHSICPKPKVTLCLAAGKIANNEKEKLKAHFRKNGWELYEPDWIVNHLHTLAKGGYDNSVASITSKLLLRGAVAL